MTEVIEYKFIYIPWDKTFPIKRCEITIVARTKEEAKKIADDKCWTFFNQDCYREVQEGLKGYVND